MFVDEAVELEVQKLLISCEKLVTCTRIDQLESVYLDDILVLMSLFLLLNQLSLLSM